MSTLGDRAGDALRRLDLRAVDLLVRRLGVSTSGTRAWLRMRDLPYVDPDAARPSDADLDRTAECVIVRGRQSAVSVGAIAGLGGLWSVTPEVAGRLVAMLRMSQRLAVVFGIDPETERGHAAVLRALAAGFDVDVPDHGVVDTRASAMVRALVPGTHVPATLAERVARAAVLSVVRSAVGEAGRLVPVLGATIAARENGQEIVALGERMKLVLARLAEASIGANIVEADEVVTA